MSQNNRTELFESIPIPKAVMTLSLPMVVSSLVTIVYSLADTYFVGMLNNPVQNAAVTLAYPVLLAFNAVNNLFGVGTSSMMSRSLGAHDPERARSCSAFGFYGALFSGLSFAIVCTLAKAPLMTLLGADESTWATTADYMFWTVTCGAMPAILNVVQGQMVRSEGAAMHASIGTMSGCILNIILDPIFILPWGLNMGAAGAGLATFLSNCFACCYYLVLARIKKGKTVVCMDIRRLANLPAGVVTGITSVGIPAAIQNLLNVVGSTILNNFTASYGASAVSAIGVSHKLYMIPMQMSLGFSQGIMPLVSYNYASGNRKRMKNAVIFTMCMVIPVMLVVTVLYQFNAPALIQLFMKNEEIVAYGSVFLKAMSLGICFIFMDFLAVGVFQSLGLGRNALIFALLRKVVLEIPLLLILNRFVGLYGLPYAQVITEAILATAAVIMLLRIFKGEPESSLVKS